MVTRSAQSWRRPLAVMVVATLVAAACGDDNDEPASVPTVDQTATSRLTDLAGSGVFVGGVAMTTTLVGIHFDRADDEVMGMRILVTDGEPGGNVEWFEGEPDGTEFSFTSASGDATIEGTIEDIEADGTVTFADGVERVFFTRPAGHGAGIFEITVDDQGNYSGESLDGGSVLEATQDEATVVGSIETADGETFEFTHNDLSRRLDYDVEGGQPDTYLAIVTRRATEFAGRGGAESIIAGTGPSNNLLSMDIPASEFPTPGVYYGRVAFETDRLALELSEEAGEEQVRFYVSDSEPEPDGDIEWFSGPVTDGAFQLTSAAGTATVDATIAGDGVTGTLVLEDGEPRRFFAAPAGDGAGIYDVTVDADGRYTGTSTTGAVLDLQQDGELVMGSITDVAGNIFELLGADITIAYRYEVPGSAPDTYVAFAAPNGRFLYGRGGNVRGGQSGLNIIGLDKKC